jgi:hypothetical protein
MPHLIFCIDYQFTLHQGLVGRAPPVRG